MRFGIYLKNSTAKYLFALTISIVLVTQAIAESGESEASNPTGPSSDSGTKSDEANQATDQVAKDFKRQNLDETQEKPMRGKYVSWKPVDGAQYYRGKIRMVDGNILPFRINSAKILIRSDHEISEIKAISSGRALVKTISTEGLIVSEEFELSKELAEKLTQFGKAKKTSEGAGPDDSRKSAGDSTAAVKAQNQKKSKLSDVKSSPEKAKLLQPEFAAGSGQVYIVREKLVASGGGSQFSGISHSLGVGLAYEKHSPPLTMSESYFYPSLSVKQHVFQLKTTEVDEAEGKETIKRISVPRFAISAGYNWTYSFSDLGNIIVGAGVGYSDFLYIRSTGAASASGELTSQKTIVIPIDVGLRTSKQAEGDQWILKSENLLGVSVKGSSMAIEILRQSPLREGYPIIGGLMIRREKFSKNLACDFAPQCSSSKSSDTQVALKIGVASIIK